jgi:hypothetical protein
MFASPVSAGVVTAVEYYHRQFEHYFTTTNPAEIAALDSGTTKGWWRTGQRYRVDDAPAADLVPVCRFFSDAFGEKAAHFFTAFAAECEMRKSDPSWTYEGVAFFARVPDAQENCAAGTAPIYRVYNNGQGGAPGHAFTGAASKRKLLVDGGGWIYEGVAFCVALAPGDPAAQSMLLAGSTWDFPWEAANGGTLRTRFDAAAAVGPLTSQTFANFGLPTPPAAVEHRAAGGSWWGMATWNAFADAYVVFGGSGFEGADIVGTVWTFDSAAPATVAVCTMRVRANLLSLEPYREHVFQPRLWSGCEAGVANRI